MMDEAFDAASPLRGVKVLDLGVIASAPFAARTLQDLGADVVKIEALDGDPLRGGPNARGKRRFAFVACNRGRRAIAVDLKTEDGKAILLRLVKDADVLIENYRPGVAGRLGVVWEKLQAANPRLIHCTITGFSEDSPRARLPITDGVIQAYAGVLEMSGPEGVFGSPLPLVVADAIAGANAAQAITAALYRRERTRHGEHIHVNMLDGLLSWLHLTANVRTSLGPPTTCMFETSDGVTLLVQPALHFFPKFASAVDEVAGCRPLIEDERFATPDARANNLQPLMELLRAAFRRATAEQWLAAMAKASVPAGPINSLAQGLRTPEASAFEVQLDDELMLLPASPYVFSGVRATISIEAPAIGENTDQILREAGYDETEIAATHAARVVL